MPTGQFAVTARPLGRHLVRISSDLVAIELHGPLSPEEMATFFDWSEAVLRTHGYALVLADCADAQSGGTQARKLAAERLRACGEHIAGAVYGMSPVMRSMLQIFSGAVRMVTRRPLNIEAFATETDARAWLDRWRPHMKAASEQD